MRKEEMAIIFIVPAAIIGKQQGVVWGVQLLLQA